MGRFIYLLCEAATLYAISAAVLIAILFFGGFHFNGAILGPPQLIVIAVLIAGMPMSLVAATIGTHKTTDAWVMRSAPVRPLAMLLPAAAAYAQTSKAPVVGGHQPLTIAFAGDGTLDSLDVVTRLADHLTDLGIMHSNVGGIHAQDGSASWRLDPVIGEDRLEGWVQAFDPTDRAAVVTAITDFLRKDLKLDVEVGQ
jgi:hypothetical protein